MIFNSEQIAAIETVFRHTLTLAGAGTGKTTVTVGRCNHLLANGVPDREILLITFTRRAANEIRSRIHAANRGRTQVFVGTFHSWAAQLMRKNPDAFGVNAPTLLDPDDARSVFKRFRKGIKNADVPNAGKMADLHSLTVNTRLPMAAAMRLADIDSKHVQVLTDASEHYTRFKRKRDYVDYDDILEIVANALQDSDLAQAVGRRFPHILIDEMQDTNPLQWLIVDALAPYCSLFCVGDDAQSIYGFRGADFESIHSFTNRLPTAKVLKLEENYRSTQEILDLSNWLLAQSPLEYDKSLRAARGKGFKPKLVETEDQFSQADYVAQTVLSAYETEEKWSNNMVLVRTGYSGRSVESKFIEYKIPYVLIGGVSLFGAKHVKDVLSLLRILANRSDELAWMRYLQLFPGIGEKTADRIFESVALGRDVFGVDGPVESLHDVLQEFAANDQSGWTTPLLQCLRGSVNPEDAWKQAVKALSERLAKIYRSDNWESRRQDFVYVGDLAKKHDTIAGFIDEYLINPVYESELSQKKDDDCVTIITIHSAKGLEASRCFVVDVQPGSFPRAATVSKKEIEEERRVLYVAFTRAADELHVCRSRRGWSSNRRDSDSESYFLKDLSPELVDFDSDIMHSSAADSFAIHF